MLSEKPIDGEIETRFEMSTELAEFVLLDYATCDDDVPELSAHIQHAIDTWIKDVLTVRHHAEAATRRRGNNGSS